MFSRKHLLQSLGISVILASLLLIPAKQTTVLAANTSDPSVVIVKDFTNLGYCTTQRIKTVGTQITKSSSNCQPGTILKSVVVPVSQAQSQHEPYVLLPTKYASATEIQQKTNQIKQLFAQKKSQIHLAVSARKAVVHPNTCVGGVETDTTFFTYYRNSIQADVSYYIPRSCGNLTIDNATVTADTYYNTTNWNRACYQNSVYCRGGILTGGCINLAPPGHTYVMTFNQSVPPGYDFVDELSPDTNCTPVWNDSYFTVSTLYAY